MSAGAAATEMVTIPAARLAELEALESQITKKKTERIEHLRAVDKEKADRVLERTKRYRNKDRDAYNARRRALYKQKKEAAAATTQVTA
jgi:Na+/phosphate symporter